MSFYNHFIKLVPQENDQAWNFKAKILTAFMLSLGFAGMAYWFFYWKVGNVYGAVAILSEASLLWYLVWSFRKTHLLERTTHICMIGYCVMMSIAILSSGGASWSGTPWLVVAPVFTTLVVGSQSGRKYFLFSLAMITLCYLAENAGVEFPDLISKAPEDANWVAFLHWFHYLGVVLYVSLITFTFDVINKAAMEEARQSLLAASAATERAESQRTYLTESVERILGSMSELAEGNLTTRLDVRERDEIGRLCEGFNTSVSGIQNALNDVLDSVKLATESSEHIAHSATELAHGTAEQSRQMNEINISVNSIATAITQSAESALHSSKAAHGNGQIAREGGHVVQETVHKIGEISRVVDLSSKSIESLGTYSREIGEIVSVIQAIASRTNLLALNASIEAAHAGEAGRGFAVIADEVKELANQTAQATEKITDMIENVQNQTTAVIRAMKEGLDKVEEGKVLAGQAGTALQEIVSSSENLIEMVAQIAQASEDQSLQSNKFLERIARMKAVSDIAVREITEIAKSTEKLETLNGHVEGQLQRFKLSA